VDTGGGGDKGGRRREGRRAQVFGEGTLGVEGGIVWVCGLYRLRGCMWRGGGKSASEGKGGGGGGEKGRFLSLTGGAGLG